MNVLPADRNVVLHPRILHEYARSTIKEDAMDTTLGFKLFGNGKLTDEVHAALAAEEVLALAEGVRVDERFSGNVPGLHSGGRTFRFSGALVITRKRVFGTLGSWTALDAAWNGDGQAQVAIDEQGLRLQVDVARVDAAWNGELSLMFHWPFTREELARFPKRALTCSLSREQLLELAGARPKRRKG
jgi:hypothetical protein